MTVTVHMHGNLRRFLPEGRDRTSIELGTGATVEDALLALRAERDTWLVAVNGVTVDRDAVLHGGDVIDCFEPVAAG